jgi:hypothetical protein
MQIFVKMKQAGRRRLVLEKQALQIADIGAEPTLQELIIAIVTQQVEAYNAKELERPMVDFLTQTQIEDAAAVGKVGFGSIYHDKKANLPKAIQNAIEAHIDGLFVVAANDKVVKELSDVVVLDKNTVLTFVKLTLLAG